MDRYTRTLVFPLERENGRQTDLGEFLFGYLVKVQVTPSLRQVPKAHIGGLQLQGRQSDVSMNLLYQGRQIGSMILNTALLTSKRDNQVVLRRA